MSNDKQKTPLADFMKEVKGGMDRMRKKDPEKGTASADEEKADSRENAPRTESIRAIDDHDDDDLIIENEAQQDTAKPKKEGMFQALPFKKKVLVVIVVLVGLFVAKNALMPAPDTSHKEVAKSEKVNEKPVAADPVFSSGPTASGNLGEGLPTGLGEAKPTDPEIGKTLQDLKLDGPLQTNPDATTLAASPTLPQGEGLGADAFGQPLVQKPALEPGPVIPGAAPGSNGITDTASATIPAVPGQLQSIPPSTSNGDPFGGPSEIPANSLVKNETPPISGKSDPILAGASLQNPDSGSKPSQQGSTDSQAKEIQAKLAAKDAEIKSLNKQLAAAKEKGTPGAAPKLAHVKAASKPARSPKHEPAVAQRSVPRASPVAKAAPRPKLCVKAVAPPARNCSTCVAHAFVVESGVDNMVGQGDFLDGYRVSITGDRLDLQNSDGQVVHKFWSQINGCPSI